MENILRGNKANGWGQRYGGRQVQSMKVKLIKLTKEYETKLGEMIDEWKLDHAMNHTNTAPWSIFKNDYHDFDYYLNHLEIKTKTEDRVPDSVFFLLDEERDRLLGLDPLSRLLRMVASSKMSLSIQRVGRFKGIG